MLKEYLLVDGYNIVHAWNDLKTMTEYSFSAARDKLIDLMDEYGSYKQLEVIIVFDAYMVKGGVLNIEKHNNVTIVYTKEAETADGYIERTANRLARKSKVRVATSDSLEQSIILGGGATRVSARELKEELRHMKKQIREEFIERKPAKNNTLFDNLDSKTAELLEKMRLSKGGDAD